MLDPEQLDESGPESKVRTVGMPNLATHVEMDLKGVASSHLDNLSTTVNRYL
jgi:hypothetical protein